MAETRESVILDITLLTRFATAQRFKDVNNSAFSRSQVDADLAVLRRLRNPSMPPLSRGFLDSHFDPKTSKGNQRSREILDAFATIFAGSGDCVAVGVIRDLEKRVVQMIIGGNDNILTNQRQQIDDFYMGLKEIAVAAERVTARQFHSTRNPPAKDYQHDLRCKAKYHEFHAMVIQYCFKKIARRFKNYGRLLDRVDDYLTPEFRERCGIESYIAYFQPLRTAIDDMWMVPARRKDYEWMDYVLALFQELHFARTRIDFAVANDELLSKEHLKNQTQIQIRERIRLSRSFHKLLITTDSATVLTKMALSPHLRSIFLDFEFKPVYLPEDTGLAPSNDVDLWMRRFQAMSIAGSGSEDGEQTQDMGGAPGSEDVEETRRSQDGGETGFEDGEAQGSGGARGSEDVEETRRSQDGQKTGSADSDETGSKNSEETHGSDNGREARRSRVDMRSELMSGINAAIRSRVNCQVHAEVKVLGFLYRHGLIDKAINSVGISKLCCPACLQYISDMGIAIQVRGTHNKWYPWHLCPDDELLSLDELMLMKKSILTNFNLDWMKHLSELRQRSLSFGNHSESSRGDFEPQDRMDVTYVYDADKVFRGEYRKKLLEKIA